MLYNEAVSSIIKFTEGFTLLCQAWFLIDTFFSSTFTFAHADRQTPKTAIHKIFTVKLFKLSSKFNVRVGVQGEQIYLKILIMIIKHLKFVLLPFPVRLSSQQHISE